MTDPRLNIALKGIQRRLAILGWSKLDWFTGNWKVVDDDLYLEENYGGEYCGWQEVPLTAEEREIFGV